jgi:hypothetical protein
VRSLGFWFGRTSHGLSERTITEQTRLWTKRRRRQLGSNDGLSGLPGLPCGTLWALRKVYLCPRMI